MEEARINLKGEQASRAGPRDEIFTKASVKGDNSENYLRQGQNHTRHSGARVTRACVYRRQKQTSQSYSFAPAEDEEEQREEEDTPKSCSYERKKS